MKDVFENVVINGSNNYDKFRELCNSLSEDDILTLAAEINNKIDNRKYTKEEDIEKIFNFMIKYREIVRRFNIENNISFTDISSKIFIDAKENENDRKCDIYSLIKNTLANNITNNLYNLIGDYYLTKYDKYQFAKELDYENNFIIDENGNKNYIPLKLSNHYIYRLDTQNETFNVFRKNNITDTYDEINIWLWYKYIVEDISDCGIITIFRQLLEKSITRLINNNSNITYQDFIRELDIRLIKFYIDNDSCIKYKSDLIEFNITALQIIFNNDDQLIVLQNKYYNEDYKDNILDILKDHKDEKSIFNGFIRDRFKDIFTFEVNNSYVYINQEILNTKELLLKALSMNKKNNGTK